VNAGETRRIVAYVADLLFSTRIEVTLRRLGFEVEVVAELAALEARLAAGRPEIIVLDLHSGTTAEEVLARAKPLRVPVLAFGRHTDAELLRAARRAGCAEVVARSTFVEEMADLVQQVASLSSQP